MKDATKVATANHIDEMACEGVAIKCIGSEGTGELGRSVKV